MEVPENMGHPQPIKIIINKKCPKLLRIYGKLVGGFSLPKRKCGVWSQRSIRLKLILKDNGSLVGVSLYQKVKQCPIYEALDERNLGIYQEISMPE